MYVNFPLFNIFYTVIRVCMEVFTVFSFYTVIRVCTYILHFLIFFLNFVRFVILLVKINYKFNNLYKLKRNGEVGYFCDDGSKPVENGCVRFWFYSKTQDNAFWKFNLQSRFLFLYWTVEPWILIWIRHSSIFAF